MQKTESEEQNMKHFIEFLISYPMKCSPQEFEISKRELPEKLPDKAIAFHFFDTDEKVVYAGNHTGWTYFGQEYSFREVEKLFQKGKELEKMLSENDVTEDEKDSETTSFQYLCFMRNNMRRYGWNRAVRACDGFWYPLMPEDTVISPLERREKA